MRHTLVQVLHSPHMMPDKQNASRYTHTRTHSSPNLAHNGILQQLRILSMFACHFQNMTAMEYFLLLHHDDNDMPSL